MLEGKIRIIIKSKKRKMKIRGENQNKKRGEDKI